MPLGRLALLLWKNRRERQVCAEVRITEFGTLKAWAYRIAAEERPLGRILVVGEGVPPPGTLIWRLPGFIGPRCTAGATHRFAESYERVKDHASIEYCAKATLSRAHNRR